MYLLFKKIDSSVQYNINTSIILDNSVFVQCAYSCGKCNREIKTISITIKQIFQKL